MHRCTYSRTHTYTHTRMHTHTPTHMQRCTYAHSSRPRGGCTWPACPRRQSPPRAPWPGRLLTLYAPCPWPKTWGSTRPRRSRQVRRVEGPVGSAVSGAGFTAAGLGGARPPSEGPARVSSAHCQPAHVTRSRAGPARGVRAALPARPVRRAHAGAYRGLRGRPASAWACPSSWRRRRRTRRAARCRGGCPATW